MVFFDLGKIEKSSRFGRIGHDPFDPRECADVICPPLSVLSRRLTLHSDLELV